MREISLTMSIVAATLVAVGCSSRQSSNGAMGRDSAGSSAATASSGAATGSSSADSIVRGTVASLTDTALVLQSPSGDVHVALAQPVTVYDRRQSSLSRLTDNSFVGVTSVSQPDGSQRATEINIFPEELRGLGEGSRPMGPPGGGGRSTMTNGSVASSRMTNGNAQMTNGAARMTNGTARGSAAGTITVTYNGGSQTIAVPAGVQVTELARTNAKLSPGTAVIVLAAKQPDGTLKASRVMLVTQASMPKR